MKKSFFLILILSGIYLTGSAQKEGVIPASARAEKILLTDSLNKDSSEMQPPLSFLGRNFDDEQAFVNYLWEHNTYFNTHTPFSYQPIKIRKVGSESKDLFFYLILGLFFILALIRAISKKYFSELLEIFYAPALSNRQLKEQMQQRTFPSFALNVFFYLSGGLFCYLLLLNRVVSSKALPAYGIAAFMLLLGILYFFKYFTLNFLGRVLNLKRIFADYSFIISLTNKILGIILLPFVTIIALADPPLSEIALKIAVLMISLLFLYRYIRAFGLLRTSLRLSKFHFFIYICSLEIAPLLILGKITLVWLGGI